MADHPKFPIRKKLIAVGSVGGKRAGLAAALAIVMAEEELLISSDPVHVVRLQAEPPIDDAVLTPKDIKNASFRPRGYRRQDIPRPKDQYRHRHQRP